VTVGLLLVAACGDANTRSVLGRRRWDKVMCTKYQFAELAKGSLPVASS